MNSFKNLIYFLIFFVISILVYRESVEKYNLQIKGELMKVKVLNLEGGKLCVATVEYLQKKYFVEIAKIDCYDNRIIIGQVIELKYLNAQDKFINPNENTKFMYYISLVFFLVPIYFLLKMIKIGLS